MEEKLSMELSSSLSFNDNVNVRNFCPKKFHSLKLFKDLPPIEGNLHMTIFDYRTTLEFLLAYYSDYSITEPIN